MKIFSAGLFALGLLGFTGCSSMSASSKYSKNLPASSSLFLSTYPGISPQARVALADSTHFLQTDPRWAAHTLGGSEQSLEGYGCLVTVAAMALRNLGFQTDPGDLTTRLKANGGFTSTGLLVWSGLERVTGGQARAVFYTRQTDKIVRECLMAGYYPLVKFDLPSRQTHWAMVVMETDHGFYIRDPMVASTIPIPLSARTKTIDAVRCVGMKA
ncbi:MAG: hypothetical protein COA69_10085 [Robiginitomaculum sp.]|nr:MAG: hypothetical protein COA69_10085 [Robiginitomaculum sp.]